MKILILSTTLTRMRAGTAHATVDIANGFARLTDADVTVAAYELEDDWLDANVHVIRYPQMPSRKFFWRLNDVLAVDQACRSLRGCDFSEFDLCYVRNTAEAVAFHRMYPRIPLITHTGAIIAGKELMNESRRQKNRLWTAMNAAGRHHWEQQSYRQRNWQHIVSTRLVASQRQEAFGLPADFFYICPLPVDAHTFDERNTTRDVRRELDIPADAPVILSVGRLTKWKNLDLTLRAVARLKSRPAPYCVIVGGGREQQPLENLAQELGIQDRVRFVGQQPETVPYYAAADLFVLLSAIESFGLVYAEAMHMGLPCIGLAHNPPAAMTAAEDVIPEGAGCCVSNEDELLGQIEKYLGDEDFRRTQGAKAKEYARSEYSVSNYLTFLAKVADEAFDLQIPFKNQDSQNVPAGNMANQPADKTAEATGNTTSTRR